MTCDGSIEDFDGEPEDTELIDDADICCMECGARAEWNDAEFDDSDDDGPLEPEEEEQEAPAHQEESPTVNINIVIKKRSQQ